MSLLFGGFKLISYNGCKSHLVMSNQQPVPSLGSETAMLRVSVDVVLAVGLTHSTKETYESKRREGVNIYYALIIET